MLLLNFNKLNLVFTLRLNNNSDGAFPSERRKKEILMVICVHNVTNKILSQDSNYIVDMVMLQKIGNSSSSNLNEVIKAVLNFFFLQKHFARTKSTKSTKTQPSKSTKRYKRTKMKNALKKRLKVKKSLICLFAFWCFLCTRRKENRRKRKVPQCRCTKCRSPHN